MAEKDVQAKWLKLNFFYELHVTKLYSLDIDIVKKLSCCVVVVLMVYHGLVVDKDTCRSLLTYGYFSGFYKSSTYQPTGCMMHNYSKSDARACMATVGRHITFMGDSRVRQLFSCFTNLISKDGFQEEQENILQANRTFQDEAINSTIEFLWRPVVNSSMWDVYGSWLGMSSDLRPSLVVTGAGVWEIRASNGSKEGQINHLANMIKMVPYITQLTKNTRIIWMPQDPVCEKITNDPPRRMIFNRHIDAYNQISAQALLGSGVHMWISSRVVTKHYKKEYRNRVHLKPIVDTHKTQILLNWLCNSKIEYADGTCCHDVHMKGPKYLVTTDLLLTAAVVFLFLLGRWAILRRKYNPVKNSGQFQSLPIGFYGDRDQIGESNNLISSLCGLLLALAYLFLCDRRDAFTKENQTYSPFTFFPLLLLMIVACGYFTKDVNEKTFLNRDITDEWKGWMQVILLIYYFTGASQVWTVAMHIRLLMSSYMFLIGYCHFSYFWSTGDFKVIRLLQVLFRMNLVGFMLCVIMAKAYLFYNFVPLASVWFAIIFVTMAMWPRVTDLSVRGNPRQYVYMCVKVAALVTIITGFSQSKAFGELVFVNIFQVSTDHKDTWYSSWSNHQYSPVLGMVVAFIHKTFPFDVSIRCHPSLLCLKKLLRIVPLVGIGSYTVFVFTCRNTRNCDTTYPYISFISIMSFVLLRHMLMNSRPRYSYVFAWLGNISVELFVVHPHIWLSQDGVGILVLLPGYPIINVILSTVLLICVCHELRRATACLEFYLFRSIKKLRFLYDK